VEFAGSRITVNFRNVAMVETDAAANGCATF